MDDEMQSLASNVLVDVEPVRNQPEPVHKGDFRCLQAAAGEKLGQVFGELEVELAKGLTTHEALGWKEGVQPVADAGDGSQRVARMGAYVLPRNVGDELLIAVALGVEDERGAGLPGTTGKTDEEAKLEGHVETWKF